MALEDARQKVERARKHIKDLNSAVLEFQEANPCAMFVEHDAKTAENVLKAGFGGKIPEQIALIAGDAIHNLRCALDLVAYELRGRKGPVNVNVFFPIAWTRKEFEAPDHQAKVRKLGIDAASIVHALQPYKGGNGPGTRLFELHALDIRDKHKSLIGLLVGFGLVTYEYETPGEERVMVIGAPCYYSDAQNEIEIARIADAQFYHEPYAPPDISFAEIVVGHEPIHATMYALLRLVDDTIDRFAPLFA